MKKHTLYPQDYTEPEVPVKVTLEERYVEVGEALRAQVKTFIAEASKPLTYGQLLNLFMEAKTPGNSTLFKWAIEDVDYEWHPGKFSNKPNHDPKPKDAGNSPGNSNDNKPDEDN